MSLELKDQYEKIYRYCYFKVKNQAIAEDLTQETFLRYFSQSTYINRGKPLAYLYVTAKNLCTDYFRRTPALPLKEELSSSDEFTPRENRLAIGQAMSSLPKELQELLLLRYSNELGVGEIAGILNISRFSVYRKLNTALKQIKELLREEDFY